MATASYSCPVLSDGQIHDYINRGGQPQRTDFVNEPPRTVKDWTSAELKRYLRKGQKPSVG